MIDTALKTVANAVDALAYQLAQLAARWRGDPGQLGPIWRPGKK